MLSKSLFLPIALFLAWMVVPLLFMLVDQLPDWIYAEGEHGTPLFWKHIDLIVSLGWAGLFLLLIRSSSNFDVRDRLKHRDLRALGAAASFMLFFSWAAGASIGGLAFALVNCAMDRSEGQEATIQQVQDEGRSVTFRIEAPFRATFHSGLGAVNRPHWAGRTRFFVHPGRLGVVWGEFL